MSDTSLVFNTVGRDRGVSALLARTSAQVRASNVAAAASTAALGGAMASAAAHAVALGSSVLGAVGAVGLLPGAVAATAATVAAAGAVTMGLGEAWKATGQAAVGGGGRVVDTARRVAAAQRQVHDASQALADAQRAALAAQEAVSRARAEEAERLDDLARAAAGAALDEERAVNAVADAERDLAAARRGGNQREIRDADLAYRQAEQTLADVRDRVEDLGQEQEQAARDGVDGSDAVRAALERQADAQRQVEQAARRLADAQDAVRQASAGAASGGVDPAAQALARLAPNARAVILTLRALQPAWEGAARAGQQRTFQGVAGDLRLLSGLYLPGVTVWLRRMGAAFNLAIRDATGLGSTRRTVADVDTILDSTARAAYRLAAGVRPLVNGFLQWAAVSVTFLPGLASSSTTIAQRFERWSIAMRSSGRAAEWISRALAVLRQLGQVAGDTVMTVVAIFRAGDNGDATLDGLTRGAAAMRAWAESAQGQQQIATVLTTLRSILTGVGQILPVVAGQADSFNAGLEVTGTVVRFAAGHLDTIAKLLPLIAAGYVLSRTAQTGANVAAVVSVPLKALEIARTWALTSAMRAHTVALAANTAASRGTAAATVATTAATTAGDVATKRSLASMAAMRTAKLRGAVASGIATAAQWAHNTSWYGFPLTWIVAAILAVIAVIVLVAVKTTWFQTAWRVSWGAIKAAAAAVGTWFVDTLWRRWIVGGWNGITSAGSRAVTWFTSIPGRIQRAFVNVATILSAPFRVGFNAIARFWNRGPGRLRFTAPAWIPGFGGRGFAMPTLPMLAQGGTLTRGGAVIVGDGGEPEVVTMPTGAQVTPLSRVPAAPAAGRGAGSGGTLRVIVVGGDRDAVAYFRRLQEQYGF
ncbi:hypothetical protein ACN27G_05980 [Plantactinospora sp. WMMB334]|uniref:hypothetical protein n=1 Tax=Plantactinospora sp. WMMB334 TaxID=3404119 RepID=UPI003B955AF0